VGPEEGSAEKPSKKGVRYSWEGIVVFRNCWYNMMRIVVDKSSITNLDLTLPRMILSKCHK
jgi:hypothetical protein